MGKWMGRCRRLRSAVLSLIVAGVSVGPSHAQGDAASVCPIAIVGIWKPAATTEADPILLSFSADGWISLLMGSGEARAQDFDVIGQVRYRLEDPHTPARIEFSARRGNDVFPPGATSWDIAEIGDSSFATINRESGKQSRWVRVQTHRYFLTFAARGTGEFAGSAFAMWTKLDGRRTELDALGVHATGDGRGGTRVEFGRVPQALSREFTTDSDRDSDAMMRLELTEAEYRRTHDVFEIWERHARVGAFSDDPSGHVMEFLHEAEAGVNQCSEKLRLDDADVVASGVSPLEFIRRMRELNRSWHVPDGAFPFVWEPFRVN